MQPVLSKNKSKNTEWMKLIRVQLQLIQLSTNSSGAKKYLWHVSMEWNTLIEIPPKWNHYYNAFLQTQINPRPVFTFEFK